MYSSMKIFCFFLSFSFIYALSNYPIEIKSISIQETNFILHNWMTSLSNSPYMINDKINDNQYKLTPIIRGLILTTDTSVNDVLPEKILCYSAKKKDQEIALAICVLFKSVLFLDSVCFNPEIEQKSDYFKTIIDHCKIVSKYEKYTLDLSRLSEKQMLEYIYNF